MRVEHFRLDVDPDREAVRNRSVRSRFLGALLSSLTVTSCTIVQASCAEIARTIDHQIRALDVVPHQPGDGVQRIEQEMRLQRR